MRPALGEPWLHGPKTPLEVLSDTELAAEQIAVLAR